MIIFRLQGHSIKVLREEDHLVPIGMIDKNDGLWGFTPKGGVRDIDEFSTIGECKQHVMRRFQNDN